MAKSKDFEFEKPAPTADDEDEATLAAVDQGVRDAKAGKTVPVREVRKLMPEWITNSP